MDLFSRETSNPLLGLAFNVLALYKLLILARVVTSWFPVDPRAGWYRLLYDVTEPVLSRVRRWIPPVGMLDLAPIGAFFLISIVALRLALLVR